MTHTTFQHASQNRSQRKHFIRQVIPHFIRQWGPVIGLMALIFFASSMPKQVPDNAGNAFYMSGMMPVFPSPWELILKKGAHLTVYAVLALLNLRALRIKGLSRDAALLGALAIVMIYAASDEFHQSFVTGRGASVRDVGIDLTGALLALSGAGLGLRYREAHRRPTRVPSRQPDHGPA